MPNITLPETGCEVTIYDYLPQMVYEKIEEARSSHIKVDMNKYQNMGIDEIADKLGPDKAQEIQDEQDGLKREELIRAARNVIITRELNVIVGVEDAHRMNRAKLGMVMKVVVSGNNLWAHLGTEEWAKLLPHDDYELMIIEIEKVIKATKEKAVKKNEQSHSLSSGEQSVIPPMKEKREVL